MSKRIIAIEPVDGFEPMIGHYLWKLEDVRARTLRYVDGLTTPQLSWHPRPEAESIGTLLLHLAAIEFSYIQEDLLGREMGEEWKIAFPIRFGIPQVKDKPLVYYTDKLAEVREQTKQALREMVDDDLFRMVEPMDPGDKSAPPTEYSIEWILYHLIEHEAHHKGQIALMKRLLPL